MRNNHSNKDMDCSIMDREHKTSQTQHCPNNDSNTYVFTNISKLNIHKEKMDILVTPNGINVMNKAP